MRFCTRKTVLEYLLIKISPELSNKLNPGVYVQKKKKL